MVNAEYLEDKEDDDEDEPEGEPEPNLFLRILDSSSQEKNCQKDEKHGQNQITQQFHLKMFDEDNNDVPREGDDQDQVHNGEAKGPNSGGDAATGI